MRKWRAWLARAEPDRPACSARPRHGRGWRRWAPARASARTRPPARTRKERRLGAWLARRLEALVRDALVEACVLKNDVGHALALFENVDGAHRAGPLPKADGDARNDPAERWVERNQRHVRGLARPGWAQLWPKGLARREIAVEPQVDFAQHDFH